MTDIRLYDTMARKKRDFVPADPARVMMYVCGPTVYNRAHIGNARPAVVFDVLARLLRHKYGAAHVIYARNITDIEDKIMAAAEREGVPIGTITARYEQHYVDDMGALGVLPPDIVPHATDHLPQMIAMMQRLIERGHAYTAEAHVLFDVGSDADYGRLARRPMDEMIAGARVEVAPYKKNAADFVLWKPSAADQPGWDSPWGRGRPGWHIECSAMIEAHFGQTIDIHAGGQDLIFPHHENEIAQSRCAHDGAPLANYWLHNGFVSMDSEKMSKSLGNVVTVGELLEQGHKGEVLRLALLMAHYRQPLDWNEGLIAEAKAKLDYFYGLLRQALPAAVQYDELMDADPEEVKDINLEFELAITDDLNTPLAIAHLHKLGTNLASGLPGMSSPDELMQLAVKARVNDCRRDLLRAGEILGLLQSDPVAWFTGGEDVSVATLVAARAAAKAAKNWAEADRIRDALKAEGILLEDRPDGTTDWRRG